MASIIEGYSYDVFISYRQKDNKGERWVSEFVESLRTELDSTSKEDISIYFDENPHDGLLETQDVDATLKEKLKCLVFVPILSRTYCDSRAFAWEHEFKAFLNQESGSRFGLKVVLPNGNVASRILPVRIHELEAADTRLVESALGGVVRGVDFIYKAPGVNRPLRLREEHPGDNVNKTYYRDQINKVANSIDSILTGLKSGISPVEDTTSTKRDKAGGRGINERISIFKNFFSQFSKKRVSYPAVIVAAAIFLFLAFRFLYLPYQKSVAVIPFTVENYNLALNAKGNELVNVVYSRLNERGGVRVRSLINSLKFKNTSLNAREIGRELKANYLVVGNINTYSGKLEVFIELVRAKNNKPLFFRQYSDSDYSAERLAEKIAGDIYSEFHNIFSGREEQETAVPARGVFTHLDYMSANTLTDEATFNFVYGDKLMDSTSYYQAIRRYDRAIESDSLFALAYAKRSIAISLGIHAKQLKGYNARESLENINRAIEIDSGLTEVQNALGFYYYYCEPDLEKALYHFRLASGREPDNYKPLFYMAAVYRNMGNWEKSQELMKMVMDLNPREALILTNIGLSYLYLHDYDSSLIYHQKAIDAMPAWRSSYINLLEAYILKTGNTTDAWRVLETAVTATGNSMNEYKALLFIYDGKYREAIDILRRSPDSDFDYPGGRYLMMASASRYMGREPAAKAYYDSALMVLDKRHLENPEDYGIQSLMGIALAGKGDKSRAIEYGMNSVRLAEGYKLDLPDIKINLARIYTAAGEYETASKIIDDLLSTPSDFSYNLLQIDPFWKPLKNSAAFINIKNKYSTV